MMTMLGLLDRGVALLGDLAAARKGRATIIARHPAYVAGRATTSLPPVDGVVGRLVDALRFAPEDEALVRAVVGETVVVEDVAAALALRSMLTFDAPIVTRDGTVFHGDGRVSGGTGQEAGAHMLDATLLIVEHLPSGIAVASVAWPGYVGTVTGVSSEGIAAFLHVGSAQVTYTPEPGSWPSAVAARRASPPASGSAAWRSSARTSSRFASWPVR